MPQLYLKSQLSANPPQSSLEEGHRQRGDVYWTASLPRAWSQSLSTDQGSSDSSGRVSSRLLRPASQSLSTDQGSSDYDVFLKQGEISAKSQSLSTDQGSSDRSGGKSFLYSGHHSGLNPSVQIRAVPTAHLLGRARLFHLVSIPQYRSGQFRHDWKHGLPGTRPEVSIPQYRSGQFRHQAAGDLGHLAAVVSIPHTIRAIPTGLPRPAGADVLKPWVLIPQYRSGQFLPATLPPSHSRP